jgi:hypothetical protein
VTTPTSGQVGAVIPAADIVEDDTRKDTGGETVGAADKTADYARAAGEKMEPADVTRADDGAPVGEADLREDMRRSGADPDAV